MRKLTRKSLKSKIDRVFSKIRRLEEADKNGMVKCITCGKTFYWKEVDCGHYITRNHMATRWLKENTAPQCKGCNIFGRGKPDIFALKIMEKYGKDELEKLNIAKNRPTKYHTYALALTLKTFEARLKELETQ